MAGTFSSAATALNDQLVSISPLGAVMTNGGPSFSQLSATPLPELSPTLAENAPRGDLDVHELKFVDNVVDDANQGVLAEIIKFVKAAATGAGAVKTASDVKAWARGSGNGRIVLAAIAAALGVGVFLYMKNHRLGESAVDTIRRMVGNATGTVATVVAGGVSAVTQRLNDARDLESLREYARMMLSADPAVALRKHGQLRALLAMSPDDVAALVK